MPRATDLRDADVQPGGAREARHDRVRDELDQVARPRDREDHVQDLNTQTRPRSEVRYELHADNWEDYAIGR